MSSCVVQIHDYEEHLYNCDLVPFMELGSVAHKYYLLNIRLPVNDRQNINDGIGDIKDIKLIVSSRKCCLLLTHTVNYLFLLTDCLH